MINNLIDKLLNINSDNTFIYKPIDETLGKMTPKEVTEKILHIVDEENSHLKEFGTILKVIRPCLSENQETNHRQWQVAVVFEQFKWEVCKEDEMEEYCWIIVDDETGKIVSKIPAR